MMRPITSSSGVGARLGQRHVVLDDRIHFRYVELRSVTKDARHVLVDLDDQPLGGASHLR
jgi:hypothetical protein